MTFRIHYTVPGPLGNGRRLWSMLGNFSSVEEAHEHALWAARQYGSDAEIFDIEGDQVVEDVPAPD